MTLTRVGSACRAAEYAPRVAELPLDVLEPVGVRLEDSPCEPVVEPQVALAVR